MELQFKKENLSWLNCPVREVRNLEQTQELKLTEGMPDIGRVLAAWGQPVLRGKEWNSDSFGCSGGMMVWVLYAPEDGSTVRCVEDWIPFQMRWDLPSGTPEGQIRVCMRPRFVDARSVSPRKIMVRAGLAALGEAYVPEEGSLFLPGEMPEDVQILINTYPVRLCMEAGEKTFRLDEDLTMPASCPAARKLVYAALDPFAEEQRVLNNRLVFRGNGNLHVLYQSEEGQLFSWDFPVSISQFADLKGSYSADAQGDVSLTVTDLEIHPDEEGHIRLKCALTAQYTVEDLRMISTVEDAYSPVRDLEPELSNQTVPAILETGESVLRAREQMHQEANVIADVSFLPDFPRQHRMGDTMELEQPGTFQVLYYGPEGALQTSTARWEGKMKLDMHPDSVLFASPCGYPEPRAQIVAEGMELTADVPLRRKTTARQELPMVCAMNIGEQKDPDPLRPSLILCRAGEESLWQLARENASTMDAIRSASGLEGEPAPGQMLLIPVL